jgi:hypothetical protein
MLGWLNIHGNRQGEAAEGMDDFNIWRDPLKDKKDDAYTLRLFRKQEPVLAYVSSLDAPSCTLWVLLHVGNSVNMKLISSYKTFSSLFV